MPLLFRRLSAARLGLLIDTSLPPAPSQCGDLEKKPRRTGPSLHAGATLTSSHAAARQRAVSASSLNKWLIQEAKENHKKTGGSLFGGGAYWIILPFANGDRYS
jgi:hypothetical protein